MLAILLLAACAGAPEPPPSASSSPRSLAGTSWRLVRFEGGDGTVRAPADRGLYTLSFGEDGAVSARIDCNRGSGTWSSPAAGELRLGTLALTRVLCPPESMHDQIVRHWEAVRSYVVRDGHLFLSLEADGGTYEWEPAPAPASP